MSELQRRALLLEHGFSVDQCNELTVVGFPDGHDGMVLDSDEFAGLQIEELLLLGSRRQRILQAIATVLHARRWSAQADAPGYLHLQSEHGGGTTLASGLPLTFWLQRENDLDVLRRLSAWHFNPAPLDDDALREALAAQVSGSIAKPAAHSAQAAQDSDDCPEHVNLTDAAETGAAALPHWAMQEIPAPPASAPNVPLAEKLRRRLQAAKSEILGTHAIWLGAKRLWVADDDDWITPSELVSAAAKRLDSWIGQGHAHVLLRFAPEMYREAVRPLLLQATQELQLECEASDMAIGAHFLADAPIAEWVMTTGYERGFTAALADSGDRNALYAPWWTLRHLATTRIENPTDWLWETRVLREHVGSHNLRTLLDTPTRVALEQRLQQTLQHSRGDANGWMAVDDIALFALAIGSRSIAETLLEDPVWQSALLYKVPGRRKVPDYFGILKHSILALSLLVPGRSLRRLIERTDDWYDFANREPCVDNTALALAIAWHRCDRAEGRTA